MWQLINAQEEWAGEGTEGSFHCVSSSLARGGCPHGGSLEACKPVSKVGLAGNSAGSQRATLGSTQDQWPPGEQLPSTQAQAAPSAGTGQYFLQQPFPALPAILDLEK